MKRWTFVFVVMVDLLAWFSAFALAYWLRIGSGWIPYHSPVSHDQYVSFCLVIAPLFLGIFFLKDLYTRSILLGVRDPYLQIFKACNQCVLSAILLSFLLRFPAPSRGWLLGIWVLGVGLVGLGRYSVHRVLRALQNGNGRPERVLMIGANEEAKEIARQLEATELVDVVGFLDDFNPPGIGVWEGRPILGAPRLYREIAQGHHAKIVILIRDAVSWETERFVLTDASCKNNVEVYIGPGLSDLQLAAMSLSYWGRIPLLRFQSGCVAGSGQTVKMMFDYALVLAALPVTAPLMLFLIARSIALGRRPILECRRVLGRNGKVFCSYGIPTRARPAPDFIGRGGQERSGPAESGAIDRWLVQSGLDRLPQLLNVVAGQMSLIGPRPISPENGRQYGRYLENLTAVRPGVMGPWLFEQGLDPKLELSLSLHYLRNWTVWNDVLFLIRLFRRIIRAGFRLPSFGARRHPRRHGDMPSPDSPRQRHPPTDLDRRSP